MAATWGASGLGHGALTGWAIQNVTDSDDNKRGTAPDQIGNDVASHHYDDTQNVTTKYKSTVKTAPAIPSTIGGVINGLLTNQIRLSTDAEGYAEMELTGHVHTDGVDGTCKSVAHGITLDRGWGASAFGVTGGESVRSSECTISCQHEESPDADGETACGENYKPQIEITVKVLGESPDLPNGYDRTTQPLEAANEDYQYTSVSGIKKLAFS